MTCIDVRRLSITELRRLGTNVVEAIKQERQARHSIPSRQDRVNRTVKAFGSRTAKRKAVASC